jgi:uncharacterized membrane protein YeaQ/YmgE (transglycosylase-associated protein family)
VQTSYLVTIVIGGIAGWLAGLILRGSGYGLIGDIVIGLLGALIGSYLVAQLRISSHIGHPWLEQGVVALIGAIMLMIVIGIVRPVSLRERVGIWWRRR